MLMELGRSESQDSVHVRSLPTQYTEVGHQGHHQGLGKQRFVLCES